MMRSLQPLVVVENMHDAPRESLQTITLSQLSDGRHGAWTILPVLPALAARLDANTDWVFFSPYGPAPAMSEIAERLSAHDGRAEVFVGRALVDRYPTAIHHYNQDALSYLDFACSFALSKPLVMRLSDCWQTRVPTARFHIDPQFELASFVRDVGVRLTDEPRFVSRRSAPHHLGTPIASTAVLFAVKTHDKNHAIRVPIVRQTWGRDAAHLVFFSDVHDAAIPTVSTDVPNAVSGHGKKLHAILQHLRDAHEEKEWFFIADDDTLLSVSRLLRLLGSLSQRRDEPLFIGQRYGYGHELPEGGYDFITLGGGMAFNRSGLRALLAHDPDGPAVDTPDDMWVGRCLQQMGIAVVHHPGFHQEPPRAYPPETLNYVPAVSFHRHAPDDPYDVYAQFLEAADRELG